MATDKATVLKDQLREAEQKAQYFEKLANKSGKARLREAENLSRVIADYKNTEQELQRHRNHLEAIIQERTSEILQTNKQLRSENAQRKEAEKALHWESSVNASLAELSKALISTDLIEDISDLVLINATDLTQSSSALVGYFKPQSTDFIKSSILNSEPDCCPIPQKYEYLENSDDPWAWVLNSRTPQRLHNSNKGIRLNSSSQEQPATHFYLSVPAMIGEQLLGYIAIVRKDREYREADLVLIEKMANLYAIAIQQKLAAEEKNLLQKQLHRSQQFEAIGTLAGGIAHDFNNIIYSILGNAELALDNIPKENLAYDDIDQIITAGKRAAELVQQILTFSMRTTPEYQVLTLRPILKETLKFLDQKLLKTVDVHLNIEAGNSFVLIDPTQIFQLILNLSINALHAIREKGDTFELRLQNIVIDKEFATTHQDLNSGDYVLLTIKDNGIGMTKETMDRIFDPFFTSKKVGEGTGMGLSTVLGIIKNHNGAIIVESSPGQGSRFDVYLPRHQGSPGSNPEIGPDRTNL